MFINSSLVNELFRGFYIQRWNDRIRPMDLIEMDKHAHKMIIAYCLGKYEEKKNPPTLFFKGSDSIDWLRIIESGIFELIRRIVISDVKSPIYTKITADPVVFEKLNMYIYGEIEEKLGDETLRRRFYDYLFSTDTESIESRIMKAAHIYASYWEFQIIKESNPTSYQNVRIETELLNSINHYKGLEGIYRLTNRHTISNFVDLFGQLRFQIRWAQTPRIPRTSVLGHSLLVACISYLIALDNDACSRRLYNAFWGGMFHDLPEAVTRDIISPLKRTSKDFEVLLKGIERELAESEIYPLIESGWVDEIKYFTQDEFANKITHTPSPSPEGIRGEEERGALERGTSHSKRSEESRKNVDSGFFTSLRSVQNDVNVITTDEMNEKYNRDDYNPYDGVIIRAADHLSAFLEAWNSINSGIKTDDLYDAAKGIRQDYGNIKVGKVDMSEIYGEFNL